MDISRLGVEAMMGYFIASTFSFSLRICYQIYSLNYLWLVVIKAVLMACLLLAVAMYKRQNLVEMSLLSTMVLIGLGGL